MKEPKISEMNEPKASETNEPKASESKQGEGMSEVEQSERINGIQIELTPDEEIEIFEVKQRRDLESRKKDSDLHRLWKPELCKGLKPEKRWKRLEIFLRVTEPAKIKGFCVYLKLGEAAKKLFEKTYELDPYDTSFGFEVAAVTDERVLSRAKSEPERSEEGVLSGTKSEPDKETKPFSVLPVRVDREMCHHWLGRRILVPFSWFNPWLEFDFSLKFFPLEEHE